ncbi:hypothetical protein WA026_011168 [Henosepilachna vigintioctopunctata]|uniref:Uncharacterized protein n=1 Tax=Henosepilachna vigintioctopunctata TaxID=420089 RepID=A0AAW1U4X3_9CUCU
MLLMLVFYFCLAGASNIITINNQPIEPKNPKSPQYVMSEIKGQLTYQTFTSFKNLSGLEISRCAISDLDPSTFRVTPLEILDIHNNVEFPTITSDTFRFLKNLEVFRFNFNPYTSIEEGSFIQLKQLKVLTISHQQIQKLTKEFLDGLDNLQELSMTNNDIKSVDKNAFAHMKELTAIYLNHNSLKMLEIGTFRYQLKLEDLQLQSNYLGNTQNSYFINWDKFDRIISLRYLNIAHNDLRHLNVQKLIKAFPSIKSINFTPNNFTCSNELYITKSLRHYRIDIEYYGNTISSCRGLDFDVIGNKVFMEH